MIRSYLVLSLAGATLASCGTNSISPAFAGVDRNAMSLARAAVPANPDRRHSWISPKLARMTASTLFVSDSATADVYIYSLPSLQLVGTVTGFAQPQGECSDTKGDVWVTDTIAQKIYELSHHGKLENVITDSAGYPAACAWDVSTGDLAVMNIFGLNSAYGSVLVYAHGSGTPHQFINSAQFYYNFGGYDANGNLFFDGRSASGAFMLSELPKGASKARTIGVAGGTIYFPGMVQWDSKRHNLIVGDQSCGNVYASCIFQLKVAGKTATILGEISLNDHYGAQVCDLIQGVAYSDRIAGSDYDFCSSHPSATYVWPYPGGTAPLAYNDAKDVAPIGAAISR